MSSTLSPSFVAQLVESEIKKEHPGALQNLERRCLDALEDEVSLFNEEAHDFAVFEIAGPGRIGRRRLVFELRESWSRA